MKPLWVYPEEHEPDWLDLSGDDVSYPNGGYVGPGWIIGGAIAIVVLIAVLVWLGWKWITSE